MFNTALLFSVFSSTLYITYIYYLVSKNDVATFVFSSFFGTVTLKDPLMKDRLLQSNFALDVKMHQKCFLT